MVSKPTVDSMFIIHSSHLIIEGQWTTLMGHLILKNSTKSARACATHQHVMFVDMFGPGWKCALLLTWSFPTTFTLATADTTTNRNRKSIRVSMGEHVTLPDQSCTRLVVVSAACCLLDHFSFCPRLCTCVVLHVYPIPTLKLTLSLPTENLRVQNIQGGLECVRHGEMVSLWWRSYDGIHMNQGG